MEQADQLILDTAERIFVDHCSVEVVNNAEEIGRASCRERV